MENIKLSIVIPSYNEDADLKKQALNQIDSFLKTLGVTYEVIVVDDKSTNNTVSLVKEIIVKKKNFYLIENEHGGKAITVMTGLLKSKGEVALFTDMDQATPISEILKVLPKFEEGYDVVIGSRQGRKGAPLIRKLMGFGFSLLRNLFLGLPFKDTQCGFKAFNRKAIDEIFPDLLVDWTKSRAKGAAVNAGFDVETLFIAKKRGLNIVDVGVDWHHIENIKQVQVIKDSLDAIKDMLRIRLNDLKGRYN